MQAVLKGVLASGVEGTAANAVPCLLLDGVPYSNPADAYLFTPECFFGVIFPKSCLKVLGAAYTRVQLICESLRYFIGLYWKIIYKCKLDACTFCNHGTLWSQVKYICVCPFASASHGSKTCPLTLT